MPDPIKTSQIGRFSALVYQREELIDTIAAGVETGFLQISAPNAANVVEVSVAGAFGNSIMAGLCQRVAEIDAEFAHAGFEVDFQSWPSRAHSEIERAA